MFCWKWKKDKYLSLNIHKQKAHDFRKASKLPTFSLSPIEILNCITVLLHSVYYYNQWKQVTESSTKWHKNIDLQFGKIENCFLNFMIYYLPISHLTL